MKIEMDLTTRVVPGGPSYPYNVAVARGPQFLALETELNPGLRDPQAAGGRTRAGETDGAERANPGRLGRQTGDPQ